MEEFRINTTKTRCLIVSKKVLNYYLVKEGGGSAQGYFLPNTQAQIGLDKGLVGSLCLVHAAEQPTSWTIHAF